jgi:hypothetical protein
LLAGGVDSPNGWALAGDDPSQKNKVAVHAAKTDLIRRPCMIKFLLPLC